MWSYLPCAVFPEVLAENRRDRGEQLRALRLVVRNGAPTVTAILVLGRDPRYWFPGAYLQFVRYDGTAVTDGIVDHAELSGPLPEQLRDADRPLRLNVPTHSTRGRSDTSSSEAIRTRLSGSSFVTRRSTGTTKTRTPSCGFRGSPTVWTS